MTQDIELTCRELIEFLMQYVDGELPAAQLRAFERHLEICPSCVAYLAGYRATTQFVVVTHNKATMTAWIANTVPPDSVDVARSTSARAPSQAPLPAPDALLHAILEAHAAGTRPGGPNGHGPGGPSTRGTASPGA